MIYTKMTIYSAVCASVILSVSSEVPSRSDQCKSMRGTKVLGNIWNEWEPYYDDSQPCVLICNVKKISHYMSTGYVTDGTPCFPGSRDKCISGVCKRKSCGSEDLPVDKCLQCDQRKQCYEINKEFAEPFQTALYEYIDLLTIPAGSTHVNIIESGTKNYIALRSDTGWKLNDNWVLDAPGLYSMDEDTSVSYQRTLGDHEARESVFILGPLRTSITVQILHMQKNEGVNISYWTTNGQEKGDLIDGNSQDGAYSKIVAIHHVKVRPEIAPLRQSENRKTVSQLLKTFHVRVHPAKDERGNLVEGDTWSKLIKVYNIKVKPSVLVQELDPASETFKADYEQHLSRRRNLRAKLVDEKVIPDLPKSINIPRMRGNTVERWDNNTSRDQPAMKSKYIIEGWRGSNDTKLYRRIPDQDVCKPCGRVRPSSKSYCTAAFVARITPFSRAELSSYIRYNVKVNFIYRSQDLELMNREFIYIPTSLTKPRCSCPRMTIDREYIVQGEQVIEGDTIKLILNESSFIQKYSFNHAYHFSLIQSQAIC